MELAPIVLFVYNRRWHTRQTVESLQKNKLADQSDLFIYSDSPKDEQTEKAVKKVREYIHTIDGFKTVTIRERKENRGLASSIIDGVTAVVNAYGRVIVLEDDLVLTEYFLEYMNEALNFYENDERVMHISGYMFPIESEGLSETFFLKVTSCWGWATWSRAWKYFEKDVDKCMTQFNRKMIKSFNLENSIDFWMQIVRNKKGTLNTWAILWYASVFLRDGSCLYPRVSLVQNIGLDGSGTDCGISNMYSVAVAKNPVSTFQENISEEKVALARLIQFYRSAKQPFYKRLENFVKRKIGINLETRS